MRRKTLALPSKVAGGDSSSARFKADTHPCEAEPFPTVVLSCVLSKKIDYHPKRTRDDENFIFPRVAYIGCCSVRVRLALKSLGPKDLCRFESGSGHQRFFPTWDVFASPSCSENRNLDLSPLFPSRQLATRIQCSANTVGLCRF